MQKIYKKYFILCNFSTLIPSSYNERWENYTWLNVKCNLSFFLNFLSILRLLSHFISNHISRKISLLSRKGSYMLSRIFASEESRFVRFQRSLQDSLPRLLSVFFSSLRIRTLSFFYAPLVVYSSPGEFNITKRNCRRCTGSRPAQEGCPQCAIVSIPSAFGMMHRCRGFAVAAAAAAASIWDSVWLVEKCKVQQRCAALWTRRDIRMKENNPLRREIMQ